MFLDDQNKASDLFNEYGFSIGYIEVYNYGNINTTNKIHTFKHKYQHLVDIDLNIVTEVVKICKYHESRVNNYNGVSKFDYTEWIKIYRSFEENIFKYYEFGKDCSFIWKSPSDIIVLNELTTIMLKLEQQFSYLSHAMQYSWEAGKIFTQIKDSYNNKDFSNTISTYIRLNTEYLKTMKEEFEKIKNNIPKGNVRNLNLQYIDHDWLQISTGVNDSLQKYILSADLFLVDKLEESGLQATRESPFKKELLEIFDAEFSQHQDTSESKWKKYKSTNKDITSIYFKPSEIIHKSNSILHNIF